MIMLSKVGKRLPLSKTARQYKLTVRIIVVIGVTLPWLIGSGIKVYFDIHSKPTWEWIYFLHPGRLLIMIWATIWLGAPSLLLAYVTRLLMANKLPKANLLLVWEKYLIIITSALWGLIGSIPILFDMFWDFDPVSLLVPFFWTLMYIDDYLVGMIVGLGMALTSLIIRTNVKRE